VPEEDLEPALGTLRGLSSEERFAGPMPFRHLKTKSIVFEYYTDQYWQPVKVL